MKQEINEPLLKKKCNGIYHLWVKRILDFIGAVILLIVLSPLFLLLAALIIRDSGLPVFYRAKRGGYKGKPFRIYKFRTMVHNADQIGGCTTALNDSRITEAGRLLRKTKLDEFPQLINIVKGEMSFIGPRPEVLKYTEQFQGLETYILQVRPGITDFSSLKFINLDEIVGETNADEIFEKEILAKKNALRLEYVAQLSFLTDVRIFLRTVKQVLKKIIKMIGKGEKNGICHT